VAREVVKKAARAGKASASKAKAASAGEAQRARMGEVLRALDRAYPDAECSLAFENPFQLLIAVMLSAQCTDERVNLVTPGLFARFPGPRELAAADLKEIEEAIKSINFFRNKALALQTTARALIHQHGGEVPRDLAKLVALRGVGRKTANVVLGVAFGEPGLVVDTHVGRLSRRLGFTRATDPVDVEHELHGIVPRERWTDYAHLMINHGRAVCTARKALCSQCALARLCPKVGVDPA
jgi:endonuclease-3